MKEQDIARLDAFWMGVSPYKSRAEFVRHVLMERIARGASAGLARSGVEAIIMEDSPLAAVPPPPLTTRGVSSVSEPLTEAGNEIEALARKHGKERTGSGPPAR
jgi:hypothetical protein